ncbi:hypothetical protein EVAR_50851_1 [Eumeta japonica]|uniref:Uncharacterized protein n=1 Tax=Eumeta variegata TaxID=151549 RepID=A0A4C1XGE1_EUMVA|nr:hypothetical protein EVAR_50851_1 [Eumeta japonica]
MESQSQRMYVDVRYFSVCAPYIFKSLFEREEIQADVRDILMKCERNERIVMLDDFNSWVNVQQDGYEKVVDKLRDERVNENDNYLLLLCQEFNIFPLQVTTFRLTSHRRALPAPESNTHSAAFQKRASLSLPGLSKRNSALSR